MITSSMRKVNISVGKENTLILLRNVVKEYQRGPFEGRQISKRGHKEWEQFTMYLLCVVCRS
jgi:hypothetical protein